MKAQSLPYHSDSRHYGERLSRLPGFVWLDSGGNRGDNARYDILAALPGRTVSGNQLECLSDEINQALAAQTTGPKELPFCGGWIGYFGYQSRHTHFRLPTRKNYRAPEIWFGWYDAAVIQDHQLQESWLMLTDACPSSTRAEFEAALMSSSETASFFCSGFRAEQSKARYLEDLQRIQAYISAGDCYQVNYTQRFSARFTGNPLAAYLKLRSTVPSPFSAYLALPGGEALLSISPERFIRALGREVMSQPIKGTAPRSHDTDTDSRLRNELLASEKNRAENLMIVDLLRNDFNQTCEPYSVRVSRLFELQSFANVHHLVSTIEGLLPEGASVFDFLASCFPGGSITGTPKKRAMEIIDELEVKGRGVYCGSIGYFSACGRSDFNIAIRTFYIEDECIYCWAGGGIVADSDPELEYEEARHKISALIGALSELT